MIATLIFSLTLNSTAFAPTPDSMDLGRRRSLFPQPSDSVPMGEENIWFIKETRSDWYTVALFPAGEWKRRLYIGQRSNDAEDFIYLALEELRKNNKCVPVWKVAFSSDSSKMVGKKLKTGTLIRYFARSKLYPAGRVDPRAIALLTATKGFASYEFDNAQLELIASWVAPEGINKLSESRHEIRTTFTEAPVTGFDYPITKEETAYLRVLRKWRPANRPKVHPPFTQIS
ncbi:hypothetical protein BH11ARM1_BH11ARM1_13020 [soil metagenome]